MCIYFAGTSYNLHDGIDLKSSDIRYFWTMYFTKVCVCVWKLSGYKKTEKMFCYTKLFKLLRLNSALQGKPFVVVNSSSPPMSRPAPFLPTFPS